MRLATYGYTVLIIGVWALLIGGCPSNSTDQPADAGPDDGVTSGDASDNINDGVVDDELIVSVTPGADQEDLDELYSGLGLTVRDRLSALSVDLLGVDPLRKDEVSDALEDSPLVEGVDENTEFDHEVTPNDPIYPVQWHLDAIGAPAAWEITTGSEQVLVAVLDTGVDTDHVDLQSKLRGGANTYDGSAGWEDTVGHGTEVAGIVAAAADSAEGVASVAWKNPILPIRVTSDDGQATSWSIAAGIALAVEQGAKVINISFAPLYHDDIVLRQAHLAYLAGALVFIASDNSGEEVIGGGSEWVCFVGAVDRDGRRAGFSTYGEFVDLAAPGVSIYTTRRDNEFGSSSGTSLATPIVSGVAALIWSVNPDLRPSTVQGILATTATDLGVDGDDKEFGAGRVNAAAAVELAGVIEEQTDAVAPTIAILQPVDQATISGVTKIELDVFDDTDLADVTLSLDGAVLASDAIAPYAFVLDADDYAAGEHTLLVTAADVFGNVAQQRITLTFAGPPDSVAPLVTIVSPAEGSLLKGTVTVIADATDDRSLARAELLVGALLIGSTTLSGVETRVAFNLDTSAKDVPSGPVKLTVRVFDTSGNSLEATVGVTIDK